jgi:branched-chain amino acid transport system ATP-binding protein
MMLECRGLVSRYGGIEALHEVNLHVDEGEIVTLLGANGAGKTTMLRTISGLHRAHSGTITFDGKPIEKINANEIVGLGLCHVPEGRRVFAAMSIKENLSMGAYLRKGSVAEDEERVFTLFPVLKQRISQMAGTLSGGEQQMLAIGRALMGRPRLLLLDEPSMGLAPLIVQQIFQIIREINQQGTTVLVVEQNASQALALASRGYVLETGSISIEGEAKSLLSDPRVREAYLGEGAA